MLDLLNAWDGSDAARRQLVEGIEAHTRAVVASRRRGDRAIVALAEQEIALDPSHAITFDAAGHATVCAAGRTFAAGRFETPSLGDLRARAIAARAAAGSPRARLTHWVLDGAGPATDIGALQAFAPEGSLFQVASQFNCLESPGPFVTSVTSYLHDPTQGPRASISAFPGTFVRHYMAPPPSPGGPRFVQSTDGDSIQLLADVCAPGVADVVNGYLRSADVLDQDRFARVLEERLDAVRLGVHDGVEVVLGADWDGGVEAPGRTIAQVFTSTVAAGGYGSIGGHPSFAAIVRQLQRAANLGTLLAAAALGKDRAVLTLIGGGVFGNPVPVIWEAIGWAIAEVEPLLHRDLTVIVNGRNLGEHVPGEQLAAAARARGGELIRFAGAGAAIGETG